MRKKILSGLAKICIRHYPLVLVVTICCTLYSLYLVRTLPFDTTFMKLLPEHSREVQFFRQVTEEYGSSTDLYLLIEFKKFQRAKDFVSALKPRLEQLKQVREVQSEFIDVKYLEEHAPLFVPLRDLKLANYNVKKFAPSLQQILQTPQLTTVFRESNHYFLKEMAFSSSMSLIHLSSESSLVLNRLSHFCDLFEEYGKKGETLGERGIDQYIEESFLIGQNHFQGQGTLREGYLISKDGRHMLVRIKLAFDMLQTELGMKLYGEILRHTRAIQSQFQEIHFGYTGHFAIGYEDQQNVLGRIHFLSLISLFMILCMFVYLDRTLYGPLLVGIPLLIAVIWTFGFVKLFFGFVSITSAIFGILLFGLGVDFAIHFIVPFHEEHARGSTIEKSIEKSIFLSGPAILVGGLTTALSFFALNVSDFKAAKHLGTTSGWGILSCLLAMLVVLPSMIMLFKKFFGQKGQLPLDMDIPLLDRWVRWVCRRPYFTILSSLLLTALLGLGILKLNLQYDIEKMISKDLPSLEVKEQMEDIFHLSTDFVFLLAPNREKAREYVENISQAKNDQGEHIFSRVESITNYLPENQKPKVQELKKIQKTLLGFSVPRLSPKPVKDAEVAEILRQLKIFRQIVTFLSLTSPSQKEEYLRLLRSLDNCKIILEKAPGPVAKNLTYFQKLLFERIFKNIRHFKRTDFQPITLENLPPALEESFLGKHKKAFAIYAYPRNSVFNRENIEVVLKTLRSQSPQTTGHMVMVYHFIYMGLKDFPWIGLTVLSLVIFLLFLDFKNPFYVALALVPIACGAVISLGLMCLAQEPINIITLLCFPLIFGIGIDDGVHVIHRYRETDKGDIEQAFASTGKAILLATLTTMASFGILLFTNHYSFISMGKLILVGVGVCFLTSVTLLPALLIIGERWGLCKKNYEL